MPRQEKKRKKKCDDVACHVRVVIIKNEKILIKRFN